MGPARTESPITDEAARVVVPGHLERILSNRPGYHDIVNLSAGIVIQNVVRAARRDHPFEGACHPDWIVIVN